MLKKSCILYFLISSSVLWSMNGRGHGNVENYENMCQPFGMKVISWISFIFEYTVYDMFEHRACHLTKEWKQWERELFITAFLQGSWQLYFALYHIRAPDGGFTPQICIFLWFRPIHITEGFWSYFFTKVCPLFQNIKVLTRTPWDIVINVLDYAVVTLPSLTSFFIPSTSMQFSPYLTNTNLGKHFLFHFALLF